MTAVTPNFSPYLAPSFPASSLVVLDAPPLSNTALPLGCYFAAAPFMAGTWRGCLVFRSPDGGATWVGQSPAVGKLSIIGFAVTALVNWPGKFTLDTCSVVRVQLSDSTQSLASITIDQLLAGGNLAFLAGELIQFQTATLVSTGVYDLSNLVRGLQGTERLMATHAIGDQFVLVDPAAMVDLVCTATQLQQAQLYIAVTNGMALSATWLPPTQFTFVGARAKPFAVAQAGAAKQTNNDIVINWVRRARLNNSWANFSDVALDETTESYRVDIMNGAVVKRSIAATTPTVTYNSAMQTTDWGAPVSSLVANIYQLSSVVGDGWANHFTWP